VIEPKLEILKDRLTALLNGNVVYMGIGNILRGDDGIGSELAVRLAEKGFSAVDAGTVPENYVRTIARLCPDTIVIIDAVHLDAEPGSVELLEKSDIERGISFTTHSLSPVMVMERLEEETNASVFILAIQPERIEFGVPLTSSVADLLEILPCILKA